MSSRESVVPFEPTLRSQPIRVAPTSSPWSRSPATPRGPLVWRVGREKYHGTTQTEQCLPARKCNAQCRFQPSLRVGGPAPLGYPAPQVSPASYTPPSPSPFEPPAAPYQETPTPIRGPEPRSTAAVDLRRLNTSNYEIDVDRRFPCSPEHVGDDGERTQVRLGVGPECAVTFPLYRVNEDRTLELVNYEVFNGNTYVVEGVFEKTALLYMDAKGRQHRATFTNTSLSSKRSRSRR